MTYKKIGVIVADKDEYEPFLALFNNAVMLDTPFKSAFEFSLFLSKVTVILCGIGKVNAAAGTMYLADMGCDCVLNFGLSGGLKVINPGEFILPERFLEHDFDLTPLGYKPCEKPGQEYIYYADKELLKIFSVCSCAVAGGTAVCGDRFISDSKSSRFLSRTFGASSCDMETAAIAYVCSIKNIPFASLRRISDSADSNAADDYKDMNCGDGKTLGEKFLVCLKGVANV